MCDKSDKLRTDAFEALANGDTKAAFALICKVLASGHATLDDIYLAGEWALDAGFYREAIDFLTQVILAATSGGSAWYLDSAYIARAYARFLVGEHKDSREDLLKITDDVELSWLVHHDAVSKSTLLAAIQAKERGHKQSRGQVLTSRLLVS